METARAAELDAKRKFWATHLSEWKSSGLSQSEYCRQNDLKLHCFLYWRKRQRSFEEHGFSLVEWPGLLIFKKSVVKSSDYLG